MSQLHKFLGSLNRDELKSVKQIRLIGKEKALFDFTCRYLNTEIPDPGQICEALEISSTHLYKINSVLLTKSCAVLVPEGGIKLLEFLKHKGLFVLIRSEARSQEKQLLSLNPGKKLQERFYLGLFHVFIDFPFRFYDKELVEEFGNKYLSSKTDSGESDRQYVRYHMLFADVNRCAATRNPKRALGIDIRNELQQEAQLKKSKHFLALYYLYRAEASWYTLYEANHAKKLSALEKAILLKDKISWFFEIDIGNFLQLLYADALFSGNETEKAHTAYSKVFNSGLKENTYGYYYFCEQYILLKIIRREFAEAEQLLSTVFATCIKLEMDVFATRGALTYTKLMLAKKDIREAIQYINTGYAINEKNFYLPFEIQLRLLETIAFAAKQDYDFTVKLCRRNIKFAEASEESKLFGDYISFWRNLEEVMRARKKGKNPSGENTEVIKNFSVKHENLFCTLPRELLLESSTPHRQS